MRLKSALRTIVCNQSYNVSKNALDASSPTTQQQVKILNSKHAGTARRIEHYFLEANVPGLPMRKNE